MSKFLGYSLVLVGMLAFATVGCDYGVAEGEDPTMMAEDYGVLEAQLGQSEDESLVDFPSVIAHRDMFLGMMESPFFGLGPEQRDATQKDKEDDGPTGVGCDVCAEQCAACMDGYICGHESEILENCNACAKCQAGCNGALDSAE